MIHFESKNCVLWDDWDGSHVQPAIFQWNNGEPDMGSHPPSPVPTLSLGFWGVHSHGRAGYAGTWGNSEYPNSQLPTLASGTAGSRPVPWQCTL